MSSKVKSSAAGADGRRSGHLQPQRQQYRVLDDASRKRRSRQMLDQLERDNFHDDPHANLVMHKKAPKFDDTAIKPSSSSTPSGGGRRHAHRTRMLGFAALLEEDAKSTAEATYASAVAPPPSCVQTPDGVLLMSFPERKFCAACGFAAPYTCITCGARFCSVACQTTHKETRCNKWTS